MKTLKSILIATIVSVAFMSFAGNPTHPPQENKVIKITLDEALTDPGLVIAMYQQLTPAMLKAEQPGLYIATVKYKFIKFEIRGTRDGWILFFRNRPQSSHDE